MAPVFFATPDEMRAWLAENHESADEVWVGLYKNGSGKAGITLSEAQDQALCFGWIDSLARRVDDASYMLRFTPRRPGSNWASTNIARVEELRAQGLMHESGIRVFEARRAVT